MQVKTGKGTIPLATLIAIWSISLTVNLPGLAITPMLDNLKAIFSDTTELEVQLLTVLPNLLIIPFVLLAGKLSLSKSKIALVVWALVAYLVAGLLYFFAKSMVALIIISCLLGCGCGLLIPLAAGLLSDTFVGKYRMKQLGIKSGISNIALVAATYIVGWLTESHNWHLPFLVYTIPLIPLVLTPFLKKIPYNDLYPQEPTAAAKAYTKATAPKGEVIRDGFYVKRIWQLIFVYFFVCYWALIVSYYMPFLAAAHHISTSQVGLITSLFFLAIFLPGTTLPYVIRMLKGATLTICSFLMLGGLALIAFIPAMWSYTIGAILIGLGYGVFQPVIYDKATETVLSERKATLALAFVLAANYLSISVTPFIVDGIGDLLHIHSNQFPFILNLILGAAFTVWVILGRNTFAFTIKDEYYASGSDTSEANSTPAPAPQASTTDNTPTPPASK
ncbi:MAG: MFS transporter [Bacteroidales bacterium]|nr:MFS transporter [Bacteroidales bacterium]